MRNTFGRSFAALILLACAAYSAYCGLWTDLVYTAIVAILMLDLWHHEDVAKAAKATLAAIQANDPDLFNPAARADDHVYFTYGSPGQRLRLANLVALGLEPEEEAL